MIVAVNKEKRIELDVRGGSFCIYDKDTLKPLSTGNLDSFRGNHENMRKWAIRKFDELSK